MFATLLAIVPIAAPTPAQALELPPVALIPPAITGVPVVGQPLGCAQGVWAGPPSSYAYRWTRAGADIPGAAAPAYTVGADDVGHPLRCRVTASNSAGSASATSPPVVALGLGSAVPPSAPPPAPGTSPAPKLPTAGEVVRLPRRRCLSRRAFTIHLKKVQGVTLAAVAVYVNGKPAKVVRGKRLRARIDLRGLPRGTVRVRIEAVTADGRVLRHTRKYKTCAEKRGPKRRHRL